jgi:redox-sensitive bicupin YhaK (pirin superfamily)
VKETKTGSTANMITKRPANTRGVIEKKGSILSYRTFTFQAYMDWRYMNFGALETINDDRVEPGYHVGRHKHVDREIFGYVVDGPCYHVDDVNGHIDIPSGAVQRMSSGTGMFHSEGNNTDKPVRYLQLWIRSDVKNATPVYNYHQFTREDKLNKFCDITVTLPIRADARLLAGIFTQPYTFELNPARKYYLYVVKGTGTVNDDIFIEGDGYAFTTETTLNITSEDSEILLFDLR